MVAPRFILARWDELSLDKVTEMVARKLVAGPDLVMAQAYFKRGAIVPAHTPRRESTIYVLQGALRVQVDAESVTVREGELLIVPAAVTRQAEALDDTFLLTVTSR